MRDRTYDSSKVYMLLRRIDVKSIIKPRRDVRLDRVLLREVDPFSCLRLWEDGVEQNDGLW